MSLVQKTGRKGQIKTARAPRLIVNVTPELIADACERDSGHCMIAEAVKVAHAGALNVSVDVQTIRFSDPKRRLRYTYLTPRVAQKQLVQFDQGAPVEPFSITLRGAAVTRMGGTSSQDRKGASPNGAVAPGNRRKIVRASSGNVPEVVGGTTPPIAALAHAPRAARRREYGMRAFVR